MTRRAVLWLDRPSLADEALVSLAVARELAARPDLAVEVVFSHDGPLREAFAEVADVVVLDDVNRGRLARSVVGTALPRVTSVAKRLHVRGWVLRRRRADLHVVVGVATARLVYHLGALVRGALVHLEPGASEDDRAMLRRAGAELIELDPAATPAPIRSGHSRADVALAVDEVVVAGVGPTDWWDAPEQVVLWAGGLATRVAWLTHARDDQRWLLDHDLRIAGLDGVVVVDRPDFLDAIPLVDVLVLAGRSPRSTLLARAAREAGVAVVATSNQGVGDLATREVPYLDLEALVSAITEVAHTGPPPPLPPGEDGRDWLEAVDRALRRGRHG